MALVWKLKRRLQKESLKEAYDAGDTDKIADANAALAQLAVEKERLRVQKVRSEQQAAQPQEIEEPQPQQVRRTEELDPKLQAWMQAKSLVWH